MDDDVKVINLRWERFKRNIIKKVHFVKMSIHNAIFGSNGASKTNNKKGINKNGKVKGK